MDGVSNQPSHAQTIETDELPKLQGQNETKDSFAQNFKTISNTQYNPHNSQGQSSFRNDGSEGREVNSQLEKHRYNQRKGGSKKYRKLGNKTIQNGSFDGGSMNTYVPASVCYGVNQSNRKANRHFFGMGNNLIVGGNLPYATDMTKFGYAPSLGGSMNNTHSGYKGRHVDAEPNSGPQRSRYPDDASNGTAENLRMRQGADEGPDGMPLDHSQNAKSLDKLDRQIQGGVNDSQKFSINLGEINRRSTGIFDGQKIDRNTSVPNDGTRRTGDKLGASDILTQLSKQLSQMTVEAIEEIQIKNPSQKFQAKLIEKEKEMERMMVENRVKKLEYEERKAQKNLAKTMHTHWVCDQVNARKQSDFDEKRRWLEEKNDNLRRQRELNTRLREERKTNIAKQRQRVIMENIMSRDQQLQEMNAQNQEYNREATAKFMEISQQTANIYRQKMEAKQRQLNNFQGHLYDVRQSCEFAAQTSIMTGEDHDNRIRQLEQFEKQILNNLQGTMKTTSALMANLAGKSEALTNTLMPRSPIVPKNKKYPKHSQFGFSIDDHSFKKRFDTLITSSPSASQSRHLNNNSGARRSFNNSIQLNRNQNSNMYNSGKSQPFHQKRSTINELNMATKLNPIIKTHPNQNQSMASTNYDTNTKFADMTANSVDDQKKIETPYIDHVRQSNTQDAISKEDGQEWTGRN